jgi:NADPH-dependent glutamate synthase beta subunit-like oxidoreductase/Pyruvate/2-oxoacid:ferredoxin oxidoreductase delta subunit
MGLLKKTDKAKPLRIAGHGGAGVSPLRPRTEAKVPPCIKTCPSDNDIRGWLTIIAQHEESKLSLDEAYDKAWLLEAETTPFPAIMGRVCPHPCEGECNRKLKDGAVAINAVERAIGDWGIERGLKLPRLEVGGPFPEKIAVVGAGPAGLSFAYQMARRGYKVVVFESLEKAGGMLRYGIPDYRLPREVIDAEVGRILELGVELRCNTTIGKEITLEGLRAEYAAVFVGIGAHIGRKLAIPGEDGQGCFTGTDFLRQVAMGRAPAVGKNVIVIGGGDTAIDAARVSLRAGGPGTRVTILYRRTRTEMPAIAREIEEALEEKVVLELLAAPSKILRDTAGNVCKMVVQRMKLGEPDSSGRRRPVPIEGDLVEIETDMVISAVSQEPEWEMVHAFEKGVKIDAWGHTGAEKTWSGGDDVSLGIATTAIGHGRKAAISVHAALRGLEAQLPYQGPDVDPKRVKIDWYPPLVRAERSVLGAEERLARPSVEIDGGITREQTLAEVKRCFSCGLCFGCQNCWMFCTPACFVKLSPTQPGAYYKIKIETCDGCKKCADECPCGFIDMA